MNKLALVFYMENMGFGAIKNKTQRFGSLQTR